MAEQHGAMQNAIVIVVSEVPDICEVGPKRVPAPFEILTDFGAAKALATKVLMRGAPTFGSRSVIPMVQGNEASAPWGGVITGRLATGGACYVVDGSHTKVVDTKQGFVIRNLDRMWMNGVAPPAPGNTRGVVIFLVVPPPNAADENGKPKGPTNPPASPETVKESTRAGGGGIGLQQNERGIGSMRDADGLNTSSPDITRTQTRFDESWGRWGTPETGQFDVARLQGTTNQSLGSGGLGYGGGGSFTVLQGQRTFGGAGDLTTLTVDAQAGTASANAGASVLVTSSQAGAQATAGVEVAVVKGSGGISLVLTLKRMWDSTFGAYSKSMVRAGDWRGARMAMVSPPDTGVVVTLGGDVGIAAGLGGEAKMKYDANSPKRFEAGAGGKGYMGVGGQLKVDLTVMVDGK